MFNKFKGLLGGPQLPSRPSSPASSSAPEPTPPKEEKPTDKDKEAKKEENAAPTPATAPAAAHTPASATKPDEKPANTANAEQQGEGQEAPPEPPRPIVVNKYSDNHLRGLVKLMRDRTELFKEKVTDQYASSPENSPPVTPVYRRPDYIKLIAERERKAEEDRIKKEEADKKKKEEAEKKKKEAEEKKKKEAEEKKDEPKPEEPKEFFLKTLLFSTIDTLAKPVEDKMDPLLGETIDPFTGLFYFTQLHCLIPLVTTAILKCQSSQKPSLSNLRYPKLIHILAFSIPNRQPGRRSFPDLQLWERKFHIFGKMFLSSTVCLNM